MSANDVESRDALAAVRADAHPRKPSGDWLAVRHLRRRYVELSLAEPPSTDYVTMSSVAEDLEVRLDLLREDAAAEAEDAQAQALHGALDRAQVSACLVAAYEMRRAWTARELGGELKPFA